MLPGVLRGGRSAALRVPSTRFSFICSRPATWPTRTFAQVLPQGNDAANSTPSYASLSHGRRLKRVTSSPSSSDPKKVRKGRTWNSYLDDLDACLPPHLRRTSAWDTSANANQGFVPDAAKTANVLWAQRSWAARESLLLDTAVFQERWRAAVWIVKQLVEHYHQPDPQPDRLSSTIQHWNREDTLSELTLNPLYLKPTDDQDITPHIKPSSAPSLDVLTDANPPEELSRDERFRHNILGLVWKSVGEMIIACVENQEIAAGEVKPEILEMIALLHHHEVMPSSIYSYLPAESDDAIQQPPTLHLLSSRILTALSDAAWQGHQIAIAEEAKKQGGWHPELPGSSYRVRVTGVKPEVWLELILWSCLHGGWIEEGSHLLQDICRIEGEDAWRAISWRDSLRAIMPFGQSELLDWDSIRHMFDTRSFATMDGVDITGLRIDRTVSSEVLNAYVDALLSIVSLGVGSRGLSLGPVIRFLGQFRLFLQQSGLNLGGGTWDAVLIRMIESGSVNLERHSRFIPLIMELSPAIGEELLSQRSQNLPPYVLDGGTAILGLLHHALRSQIRQGNLEAALSVFRVLQQRVDDDRHASMVDFFQNTQLVSAMETASRDLFTSNFSGIDYPAFDLQIPAATLAEFLMLVTENKAYDLGRWMLENADIDGPIIPKRLWSDHAISSALVGFATAVGDMDLLSHAIRTRARGSGDEDWSPRKNTLQAILNSQIEMRRWDSVTQILEYVGKKPSYNWNIMNAATLIKVMLSIFRYSGSVAENDDSARSRRLFADMIRGNYGVYGPQRGSSSWSSDETFTNTRLDNLCTVLSAVDGQWADFCSDIRKTPKHFPFVLGASVFNQILDGTLKVHGAAAGRRLVQSFWNYRGPDKAPSKQRLGGIDVGGVRRLPRFLYDAIEQDRVPRSVIELHGRRPRRVAMYGSLEPNSATMRLIYKKALEDYKRDQSGYATIQILDWVLTSLSKLRLRRREAYVAIRGTLSLDDLERLRTLTSQHGWLMHDDDAGGEGEDEEQVDFAKDRDSDSSSDASWWKRLREKSEGDGVEDTPGSRV